MAVLRIKLLTVPGPLAIYRSGPNRDYESAFPIHVILLNKVTLPGSPAPDETRTKAPAGWRQASRQAPPSPCPHSGHAVELPALFFGQDVIQENPLRPVQLLRVVDKRDVLVEQRTTCRDRAHCLLCYLRAGGGSHRTPSSLQGAGQEEQLPREYLGLRQMTHLELAQQYGFRFLQNSMTMYYICIVSSV